ncbi:MAG TPA: sigma-70 family RNA polymerase sigma factor [Chitinophagaceae bacterium]|nr:sigma-70 family RNA polymerase sigma factor [Chitinophagaceae bacterium]
MNPNNKYTEQELVSLLLKQNDQAFSYLYDNYSPALFGIINQIIADKDIAADVLQDVFINIWKKISSYDDRKGRLFTWMLNIARNAAIDKIRSRPYQDNLKNQPLTENVNSVTANIVVNTQMNDVGLKRQVNKLKEDYRVLIDLSYFQGFTHEEISKILNLPLGTVKTRIRSALIQLRTLI